MKALYSLCLVLFLSLTTPAWAQFDLQSFITPEIGIELQPEYPRPGETVKASLNDYSGGFYGSEITWFLNGQEIPDAKNKRNTQITAGAAGVEQIVEIVLTKPTGGREVLRSVILPSYLDIVIEPQTRTPNFYLGRSLPSVGSVVNATAIVSTDRIRTDTLIYTWRLNNRVIEGGPLRGGNKVSFETPMGEEMVLSLMVTDLAGRVISSRSFLLPSVMPSIQFYEVSSLFGVSHKPIGMEGFILTGDSATVRAEPYNLDSRVYNNPDISIWSIDRTESKAGGGNPYELTLQRVDTGGRTNINFHVRDMTQVLQGAEESFQVNY
tara:strand:+ start:5195 stop:6163 length:969 start_codon:yes stop_codon:yes gene_type:complete